MSLGKDSQSCGTKQIRSHNISNPKPEDHSSKKRPIFRRKSYPLCKGRPENERLVCTGTGEESN